MEGKIKNFTFLNNATYAYNVSYCDTFYSRICIIYIFLRMLFKTIKAKDKNIIKTSFRFYCFL